MALSSAPPAPPDTAAADVLRRELEGRFPRLRFAAALEPEFVAYLRGSQLRNLRICTIVAALIWLLFLSFDFARQARIQDAAAQALFFWTVPVARCATLAVILLVVVLAVRRRATRALPALTLAIMVLMGATGVLANLIYQHVGLPYVPEGLLLLVSVTFLPVGLRFYESLGASLLVWVLVVASAGFVPDDRMAQHAILVGTLLLMIGVSALGGYLREHAVREQFLLRRLLSWEALHDPLTGLANRRMFTSQAERLLAQAEREGVPLSLAMIDVDHFKRYNDRYGHQAGDEALRRLGALIARYGGRPLDIPVRLGGEEFGLLAYGESAESLGHRMEQLLADLRAEAIPHADSPTADVLTLSAGVAEARERRLLEPLMRDADRLLYQAKEGGRARVVVQALRSSW